MRISSTRKRKKRLDVAVLYFSFFFLILCFLGYREERDDRPRRSVRRTPYSVIITGLPRRCSWQDLKDFTRKVGDVVFADINKYGEGIVDFSNRDDMENAIKNLDDTEFKTYDDSTYIRVKESKRRSRSGSDDHRGSKRRDRSQSSERSRSRERKRSPSRSPSVNNNDDKKGKNYREEERLNRDREREETVADEPSGDDAR
jgi:arginine/serine-rich splicing factor 4/5/6